MVDKQIDMHITTHIKALIIKSILIKVGMPKVAIILILLLV